MKYRADNFATPNLRLINTGAIPDNKDTPPLRSTFIKYSKQDSNEVGYTPRQKIYFKDLLISPPQWSQASLASV